MAVVPHWHFSFSFLGVSRVFFSTGCLFKIREILQNLTLHIMDWQYRHAVWNTFSCPFTSFCPREMFSLRVWIKFRPVQCRHSSNGGQTQWSISWPRIGWMSATSPLLLVHSSESWGGLVSAARPRLGPLTESHWLRLSPCSGNEFSHPCFSWASSCYNVNTALSFHLSIWTVTYMPLNFQMPESFVTRHTMYITAPVEILYWKEPDHNVKINLMNWSSPLKMIFLIK